MIIGYQGELGCYSYNSIKKYFKYIPKAFKTFKDIFIALNNKEIDYGYIPINNTLGGRLHENDKLIIEYNIKIIEKYDYKINHNLIVYPGVKKENIKYVQSHWQALAQCREYLLKNNLSSKEYYDTSAVSKYISDNDIKDIGAIASKESAQIYNLEILEEDIQDNDNNVTTFLLIKNND